MSEDIARTMFGVGGLIVDEAAQKILLLKRSSAHSNFNQEKWELLFGRKNAHEGIIDALKREAKEELGLDHLIVREPLRIWHFYRGSADASNEIVGITFVCEAPTNTITLSAEHSEYRWVSADVALDLVTVPGIREDIKLFRDSEKSSHVWISEMNQTLVKYPGPEGNGA